MQIIFLPTDVTIVVDIIAWVIFHLGIGYRTSRLPVTRFDPNKIWYQTFPWEKGGEIYEKIFHVRSWKKYIPSGGKIYPNTFSIQKIKDVNLEYLTRWLIESCRAEYCHLMMILPGLLFFLWNSVTVGWWMLVYAIVNNLVPIVLQRYNRPRIRRMIARIQNVSTQQLNVSTVKARQNEKEILNPDC